MDELQHVLASNIGAAAKVSIFGLFEVDFPVVVTWGIMVFLVLGSYLATRNLKRIPGKGQMLLEMAVGGFNNFCKANIGKHWRPFAPWLGTVALYILCCNLITLFAVPPPTKTLSITAALAILSVVLIYGAQLRYRGLRRGLLKFAQPIPFLLPLNVLEIFIRPLSLCMRLFGNVLATFLIMEMVKCLVPLGLPAVLGIYFDLFDGVIQAVVFIFLTTLFLGEAVEDHE